MSRAGQSSALGLNGRVPLLGAQDLHFAMTDSGLPLLLAEDTPYSQLFGVFVLGVSTIAFWGSLYPLTPPFSQTRSILIVCGIPLRSFISFLNWVSRVTDSPFFGWPGDPTFLFPLFLNSRKMIRCGKFFISSLINCLVPRYFPSPPVGNFPPFPPIDHFIPTKAALPPHGPRKTVRGSNF